MTSDNWKHRADNMRCGSCMYFVEKEVGQSYPTSVMYSQGVVGRCRRHAPTLNGFPVVFKRDWCGDHKLDENKV